MANINSAHSISCGETSQDYEDCGYEDDLTAQPATSTSTFLEHDFDFDFKSDYRGFSPSLILYQFLKALFVTVMNE